MLQEGHKLSLNLKISIHPAWSTTVHLSCSIWLLSATPDAPLWLFSSLSCFAPEMASKPAPLHGFTPHSLFAPLSSAFSYFLVFTFPGPTSEELPQQTWRPGVTPAAASPGGCAKPGIWEKLNYPNLSLSWSCGWFLRASLSLRKPLPTQHRTRCM